MRVKFKMRQGWGWRLGFFLAGILLLALLGRLGWLAPLMEFLRHARGMP